MRPSVYERLERAPFTPAALRAPSPPPGPFGPDLPTSGEGAAGAITPTRALWARPPHKWGGEFMSPTSIVDAIGYPAAGLGILIESAGIPFPGEVMLLAAAAWSAARN